MVSKSAALSRLNEIKANQAKASRTYYEANKELISQRRKARRNGTPIPPIEKCPEPVPEPLPATVPETRKVLHIRKIDPKTKEVTYEEIDTANPPQNVTIYQKIIVRNKKTKKVLRSLYKDVTPIKYTPEPEYVFDAEPVAEPEPEPIKESDYSAITLTRENAIKVYEESADLNPANKKRNLIDLNTIFWIMKEVDKTEDIKPYLMDIKRLIKLLEKATQKSDKTKKYATNSKVGLIAAVTNFIKYSKIHVPDDTLYLLNRYWRTLKWREEDKKRRTTIETDTSKAVLDYNILMKLVLNKFGTDSIEYLLVRLYNEAMLRDDYSNINLVENKDNLKDSENYIVLPKRGNAILEVNEFKTAHIYKQINQTYTADVTKLLRKYVNSKGIKYGSILFPFKISPLISKMNKEIGIKGSINYFRHSWASTLYANPKTTEDDIIDAIEIMRHKTGTFGEYLRPIKKTP